jgi:hypothetical protein
MKKAITSRIAVGSAVFLLLGSSMQLTTQAQPSFEGTIDQAFKNNSFPGAGEQGRELIVGIKQWIGPYKKAQKNKKDDNYLAIFDRGSLPIKVSGLASVGVGCPVTKLPLSKAPSNIQKAFAKCPNLKA